MKTKILYITPPPYRSFLKKDAELLKKYYKIRVIIFDKLSPPLIFKLFKGVLWADITFSWFADTHAFLAVLLSKLFRKKSIVVVGGYEVAKVPEIGYGALLNPKSARKVKYVLENADKVLAVSNFNKKEILEYMNLNNVKLVYNGVDITKFKPAIKKEDDLIITVAGRHPNIKLKGLDTFIKTARFLPEKKFVVIGLSKDLVNNLEKVSTSNVTFAGFLLGRDLIQYYQKANVYCQLSYRESFGMALAEAMACGCIPVVTNRGALPEVVGETGFYVPYGDPRATAEAIKEALKSDKGKEARERIKRMFPLERRERELIGIIKEMLK